MWVLTFKTLSGPVATAGKIFRTRLEALTGARKLKEFKADITGDPEYIAGTGKLHGTEYTWSIELATV